MIAKLRVRMRVGGSCERNPFPHTEFDDSVRGIKFVYGLAPSSGGKLNREIARTNKIERLVDDRVDLCIRPMTVDFDKIEMGQTIDEPSRGYFADTPKVIGVNGVDTAALELFRAGRHAVEHLIGAIEEMNRAQDKIELVPMLLDPFSADR